MKRALLVAAALALAPSRVLAQSVAPPAARTGFEAAALYASTVGYGVATGAWINTQADLLQPATFPWLPLAGAGAGVGLAWLADHPRPMRAGLPTAIGAGLSLGILGGAALGAQGWMRDDWGPRTAATVMWAGATLGLGMGLGLGLLAQPTPGAGSFVLSGGFWGASLGAVTGFAVDALPYEGSFAAAGEAIGAVAAAVTASTLRPTPSQVRWMDLGALTGALLGGGLGLLFFRTERAPFASLMELGVIGGGVAGFLFGAPRSDGP